jgi:hypothetical protein
MEEHDTDAEQTVNCKSNNNRPLMIWADKKVLSEYSSKIVSLESKWRVSSDEYVKRALIEAKLRSPFEIFHKLHTYQKEDCKWMLENELSLEHEGMACVPCLSERSSRGGVLGLSVGLGKTAMMATVMKANPLPRTLIVTELSVIEDWKKTLSEFEIPGIYRGKISGTLYYHVKESNEQVVVVTNYQHLVVRGTLFSMIKWDRVVMDEGQMAKKARKRYDVLSHKISAPIKWILSATFVSQDPRNIEPFDMFSALALVGCLPPLPPLPHCAFHSPYSVASSKEALRMEALASFDDVGSDVSNEEPDDENAEFENNEEEDGDHAANEKEELIDHLKIRCHDLCKNEEFHKNLVKNFNFFCKFRERDENNEDMKLPPKRVENVVVPFCSAYERTMYDEISSYFSCHAEHEKNTNKKRNGVREKTNTMLRQICTSVFDVYIPSVFERRERKIEENRKKEEEGEYDPGMDFEETLNTQDTAFDFATSSTPSSSSSTRGRNQEEEKILERLRALEEKERIIPVSVKRMRIDAITHRRKKMQSMMKICQKMHQFETELGKEKEEKKEKEKELDAFELYDGLFIEKREIGFHVKFANGMNLDAFYERNLNPKKRHRMEMEDAQGNSGDDDCILEKEYSTIKKMEGKYEKPCVRLPSNPSNPNNKPIYLHISTKMKHLIRLLYKELTEFPDSKIIVFTNYIKEQNTILKYVSTVLQTFHEIFLRNLEKKVGSNTTEEENERVNKKLVKCFTSNGSMKCEERKFNITQFMSSPNCSVLIAQIDSCKNALNLQAANVAIFMSPPTKPDTMKQAVGRIHRQGQNREVRVYNLAIKDTIESC